MLAAVEYPLADSFVAAHPSNYVVDGMQTPQRVIIHQMDGTYQSTLYWFQDPGSNVSTHYIMRASDGLITQMVAHKDMGQHIGGYNPTSFGIEHEGFIYEPGWFTWEAYVASAQLTRWLCDEYDLPLDRDHIVGHVEVPGASHTDPGPYWDWEMYMALVHDVVGQGRVEGVVVDQSQPCVLTALADTWITTTLESLSSLDDGEHCYLPAGTELTYLHASDEMISQARLTMPGGGPCAGIGDLDTEAYVYLPSFTPLCEVEPIDPDTLTITLDGAQQSTVDAQGRFVFHDVPPGPHIVDVMSDDAWEPTSAPVEIAVYPGARVVIPIEPSLGDDSGDDGNDDGTTTATTAGDSGDQSSGGEGSSDAAGESTASVLEDDDEDQGETDRGGATLPQTSFDPPDACACTSTPRPPHALFVLGIIALLGRRRPRVGPGVR